MSQRILIAGPWIGEFGWELFSFQARLRVLARSYDQTIVLGTGAKEPLYADFAVYRAVPLPEQAGDADGSFRTHLDADGEARLRAWCQGQRLALEKELLESVPGVRISQYAPESGPRFPWIPTYAPHQKFRSLALEAPQSSRPLVLLVTRERQLAPERNAAAGWWDHVAGLLRARGITVERFAANLTDGLQQLSQADLAVGASTGGLHLAALCGCPYYAWGPGPAEQLWNVGPWRVSSAYIHKVVWNPFGTPVIYDESGWNPEAVHTASGIAAALETIGRTTGDPAAVARWRRLVWRPERGRLVVGTHCLAIQQRFSYQLGRLLLNWTAPHHSSHSPQ